ncbi:hypothetical protein V8C26DRAFT_236715 [Trichoderma gracile]
MQPSILLCCSQQQARAGVVFFHLFLFSFSVTVSIFLEFGHTRMGLFSTSFSFSLGAHKGIWELWSFVSFGCSIFLFPARWIRFMTVLAMEPLNHYGSSPVLHPPRGFFLSHSSIGLSRLQTAMNKRTRRIDNDLSTLSFVYFQGMD